MEYKLKVLNNNIPLFAIVTENSQIILRTSNIKFAKRIKFLLNNQDSIEYFINFMSEEIKDHLCKTCIPSIKCGDCRFVNFIENFRKLKNEISQ